MRIRFQVGAALLFIATLALLVVEFVRFRAAGNSAKLGYTSAVKKHDIVDAAQKSLDALRDAELREQNYILTGETVYSEAYAEDIHTWQDESGTLALVTEHDPTALAAREFIQAGTRTADELAAIVGVYEKSGREAALQRISRSSGIVYLDQAGKHAADVMQQDTRDAVSRGMVNRVLASFRSLAVGAGILALLSLAGSTLLFLTARRAT